jgi:enoyl-CoA hydratase/carnithine racemase
MSEDPIRLEIDGPIATLILNRPAKLNALNRAIWQAIPALAHKIEADAAVRAVIVRGADERAFSAGADIAEFAEVQASAEAAAGYNRLIDAAYDALAELDRPTIAMIRGVCYGGGAALALCCDLRYADESARFCIPPARLGLVYTLAETKRLHDLVGPSKAKEMLMGATVVGAEEARRIGLVHEVVPLAGLGARGDKIISTLLENAPGALARTKQHILEHAWGGFDAATLDALIQSHSDQRQTAEAAEGLASFAGKRSARWAPE